MSTGLAESLAVTQERVNSVIASEHYFTATEALVGQARGPEWQAVPRQMDMLTFCVLVLKNGFTVSGEAYCQDPAFFDVVQGRQAARADAVSKIWPVEIYLMKQLQSEQEQTT
jgi:hypothetical protein